MLPHWITWLLAFLTAALAPVMTLGSLQQVDDHPLYVMTYYGDYTVNIAPAGTAQTPPAQGEAPAWGCSLFAALGDARHALFGRNFDWQYSPALLLFTDPADGYAAVTMVDVAYLGYPHADRQPLTELPLRERVGLLDAPLIPFDGMNEHGLVIGMAAVTGSRATYDPARDSIGSLGIMREVLDHTRTVDEAVTLISRYNVDFTGGPAIHYLIADASGAMALVEFYQDEMIVQRYDEATHTAATNFIESALGEGDAPTCWRHNTISRALSASGGAATPEEAMVLLAEVAQPNTQWSIIYEISSGDVFAALGQDYTTIHTFNLPLAAN